jgi:hypothetical protein
LISTLFHPDAKQHGHQHQCCGDYEKAKTEEERAERCRSLRGFQTVPFHTQPSKAESLRSAGQLVS